MVSFVAAFSGTQCIYKDLQKKSKKCIVEIQIIYVLFFVLFVPLSEKTNHQMYPSRHFQMLVSCLMTAGISFLMMHGISPVPAHAATAYSAK